MPRTGFEEITPELVAAAAEYFGINEDAALQKMLHEQARKARETPMPQGLTVRDQYVAPSVLGVLSSTLERIQGGQDEQKALAQLQAGILRKKDINTMAMQADMDRRNPPLTPENGAMMSPDPSTMTSENTFATTPPWEDPLSSNPIRKPVSRGVRKPVVPPGPLPWEETPQKQSRMQSPFYGFRGQPPFPLVK
jgi:hypothetical protein